MLSCEAKRGALKLKGSADTLHDVSGVIGITGKAAGTVVVSLSTDVARKASAAMLMMDEAELADDEIIDAVGEITNMVAGSAKAKLEEYELSISLPNVITGSNHVVRFPKDIPTLCVPFDTQWGDLMLEVGLVETNS